MRSEFRATVSSGLIRPFNNTGRRPNFRISNLFHVLDLKSGATTEEKGPPPPSHKIQGRVGFIVSSSSQNQTDALRTAQRARAQPVRRRCRAGASPDSSPP